MVTGRMTKAILNIAVLDGAIGTSITLSVSTRDIIHIGKPYKCVS